MHWGELQELANQAANLLAALGVESGDRVAVVCRRRPRRRRSSSRHGSSARSCSRCRCSTATRGSRTGSGTRAASCSSPTPRTRRASRPWAPRRARCSTSRLWLGGGDDHPTADTAADDPAQLYYTSGTTGLAKGIVHAHRYILAHEEFDVLPRGRGRRALPRDGGVGLGGRDRAAARTVAPRRGAVRLPARGRLRSAPAARLPLAATRSRTSSRPRPRCAR